MGLDEFMTAQGAREAAARVEQEKALADLRELVLDSIEQDLHNGGGIEDRVESARAAVDAASRLFNAALAELPSESDQCLQMQTASPAKAPCGRCTVCKGVSTRRALKPLPAAWAALVAAKEKARSAVLRAWNGPVPDEIYFDVEDDSTWSASLVYRKEFVSDGSIKAALSKGAWLAEALIPLGVDRAIVEKTQACGMCHAKPAAKAKCFDGSGPEAFACESCAPADADWVVIVPQRVRRAYHVPLTFGDAASVFVAGVECVPFEEGEFLYGGEDDE